MQWAAYKQKRGTLNDGLRIEIGFGQLLAMVARACGNEASPFDFMPHVQRPPEVKRTYADMKASLVAVAPRRQKNG